MHTAPSRDGFSATSTSVVFAIPAVPRLSRRLVLAVAATIPLLALGVAALLPADPLRTSLGAARLAWLELALATPVVLWAGVPVFRGAVAAVGRRRLDATVLVTLGALAAYAYAVASTVAPSLFPRDAVSRHGAPDLYFAAASSTVTVVLVGRALERAARRTSRDAVHVAIAATPMRTVADRVGAALVPAVVAIAVITFIGWLMFGPEPRLAHAVASAVAVLVIACPAAFALATPMSFLMGASAGNKGRIVLRDPNACEELSRVTTLLVDRSGMLTAGRPRVDVVEPARGVDRDELLRLVAAAEAESDHPVARAVVAHARTAQSVGDDDGAPVSLRRHVRGSGVVAAVSGRDVAIGTVALLAKHGVAVPEPARERAEALQSAGDTVVFAAIDGAYAGLVAFGDASLPFARDAIAELRRMGIRVVMTTGAARSAGTSVARELDLHEADVFARRAPDDRARMVAELASRGEVVGVVAAGSQHDSAVAAAHVGIAVGDGPAPAGAGVVLPGGDLRDVVRTVALARRTTRNVRENLALAFGYNLLAIPLAAGVCYALTGTALSPLFAALAMGLGIVSVVTNALRLRSRVPTRVQLRS